MLDWFLYGTNDAWWSGTWASLGVPFAVLIFAAVKHWKEFGNLRMWLVSAICFVASVLSAYWSVSANEISLHIVPYYLVSAIFAGYWRVSLPTSVLMSHCFLTLALTDVVHAVALFHGVYPGLSYLVGIGGAGLKDGLFIFPMVLFVIQSYIKWRRQGQLKLGL